MRNVFLKHINTLLLCFQTVYINYGINEKKKREKEKEKKGNLVGQHTYVDNLNIKLLRENMLTTVIFIILLVVTPLKMPQLT